MNIYLAILIIKLTPKLKLLLSLLLLLSLIVER